MPAPEHGAAYRNLAGREVEVVDAVVVVAGTGAAGFRAADRLAALGVPVTMVVDKVDAGTSRNAGSDKQTYYKISVASGEADSVREMAETLFSGGAMDGDVALVEAAWSAPAFFHLVESGVPFPYNRYGEFVGYKTDHDPRQRATSAGPYTSKSMVECLQARVESAGVVVLEGFRIVDLVTDNGRVCGLLCWRVDQARFVLFRCDYLVYATGGPAGIYADSVYPHGQWGAQGAALRAGARGKNLTEWQFGLASLAPRWNVSGSYMQVIPRFVSTDADGGDEREFLSEAVPDPGQLASLIFLKGYQWPFDARKAHDGSSLIDLLVYRETVLRGRAVYLDFRRDFGGYDPGTLSAEASSYLAGAGALDGPTPLARLRALNEPAYQFYRERNPGIDLAVDRLRVAVCSQHNNGGLAGDHWWQSNLRGLFPIGEAAGAHGVYRPGGAALNSGQVGAMRAASYIARDLRGRTDIGDGLKSGPGVGVARCAGEAPPRGDVAPNDGGVARDEAGFLAAAESALEAAQGVLDAATASYAINGADSTGDLLNQVRRQMSDNAGLVRSAESITAAVRWVEDHLIDHDRPAVAADPSSRRSLDRVWLLRDILTSQYVYLSAMADYLANGGRSRGSVIYTDPAGELPKLPSDKLSHRDSPPDSKTGAKVSHRDSPPDSLRDSPPDSLGDSLGGVPGNGLMPESFRFRVDGGALDEVIQEAGWAIPPVFEWRPRRPIPTSDEVFETVWAGYRATGSI